MKYILSHKNIAVAKIQIDSVTGTISKIGDVLAPEHVPVGVAVNKGIIDRHALNEWWKGRSIPASRQGLRDALDELKVFDAQLLLEKCLGLSLSDQYWIYPADSDMRWEDVNFFDNAFSDDIGDILFGKKSSGEEISLMSPDNTSDGWLRKKWKIIDGKRCLIKGGSGAIQQEPVNEVLSSCICKRLGIFHIPYELFFDSAIGYEQLFSVCDNFVTKETELISAWYILQTQKRPNNISNYQHYLNRCEELGIPGAVLAVDQMLALDFIIANEDRHFNNFGFIRNADTLEWVDFAPIFDCGTSLWHNSLDIGGQRKCQPFCQSHEEQLRLVSDLGWFDMEALKDVDREIAEIFSRSPVIDETRSSAIIAEVLKRAETVAQRKRGSFKIWV